MKRILIPVFVIMLLTMACAITGSGEPTKVPPTEAPLVLPTETPFVEPTEVPTIPPPPEPTMPIVIEQPTEEETGGYFVEEFDDDLSSWVPFVITGDPNKEYARVFNERLRFELPNNDTYAYVENVNVDLDNVYLETEVETVFGRENAISMFCRGSDKGFYEFRIHTVGRWAGTYEVYRFDFMLRDRKQVPYVNLLKDRERFSTYDIKGGLGTNTLGMMCVDDEIRLYINGVEQLPMPGNERVRDNTLKSGTVGLAAMSFGNGQVQVEFNSVSATAP